METFGQWLAKNRKRLGLTQEELGRRVGVTGAYISSLERDVVESKSGKPIQPSIDIVDSIAKGFQVSTQEARIAARYSLPRMEESDFTQKEITLIESYRNLSSQRQADIFNQVQFYSYENSLIETLTVDMDRKLQSTLVEYIAPLIEQIMTNLSMQLEVQTHKAVREEYMRLFLRNNNDQNDESNDQEQESSRKHERVEKGREKLPPELQDREVPDSPNNEPRKK